MPDDVHRAYRVGERIIEGHAGVTLVLDGRMPADAGQFAMVWLPGIEERPYAVADDDPLTLSVQAVGPFSRALAGIEVGGRVWVRGPYGLGFRVLGRRHLLIGGGSGLASLLLLAKRLREAGHVAVVAAGARSADQLMLTDMYEGLGCHVLRATDDGSMGYRGTALAVAEPVLAGAWPEAVYACGPDAMLRATANRVAGLGCSCQLSLERAMKCGIGVCGHCHCGPRLVCQDGPVFDSSIYLPPRDASGVDRTAS